MPAIVPGPTYAEMRDPARIEPETRRRAQAALHRDELDPVNLFNIHWKDEKNRVRKVVLPPDLTGVEANIVVLVGKDFPSGSHKVGPAYATLVEAEVEGEIEPGSVKIVGPSTGNFGIGTAYIARLKGYGAVVVMPDSMSKERYERIRRYGGELDLTPGTESDVILTLRRAHKRYQGRKGYKVLAQFELLPNYRFHRHVTAAAALEAVEGVGNGKIAAFSSAPGSAGTIGAADCLKARFPDCVVVALEPRECPTLTSGGQGQHRIEGIGDKMVVLIHNVLTTDYVALIHDQACVRGLRVLQERPEYRDLFGISSVCNILGAIKTARLLGLGRGENVVTIATDGFDRYPSVMADLEAREGPATESVLRRWHEEIFLAADTREFLEVRRPAQKERLFRMKEEMWSRFGYPRKYLDRMKSQAFWDEEYAKIPYYDERIAALRSAPARRPRRRRARPRARAR